MLDLDSVYDNVQVSNNIFVTTGGVPLIDNPRENDVRFQGNAYYGSGSSFKVNWNGVSYPSLSAFRLGTGQERLDGESVGYWLNPRLRAAGRGGTVGYPGKLSTLRAYTLRGTSRMIGRGLDLRARFGIGVGTHDFYGNRIPRGTRFDLGVHEAR